MSVVLVTGSSTGIGLATALHFGRLDDGVYAGVRSIASATELTTAIEAERLPVHPIVLVRPTRFTSTGCCSSTRCR